jgi:molybdopterin/thiamine biosynthesis adenylyltransferase
MPDSDSVLDRHRAEATAVLSSYIETLPAARELLAHELRVYSDRDFAVGWRVTVEFSDKPRRLDVLVGTDFPFEAVRFALVDRPEFLTWPHVERDGLLCLLQSNSNVDHGRPLATFQNLLGKAHRLIEECIAGTNATDFEAEFETYWNYAVSDGTKPCRSLLTLDGKNRVVSIWRGKDFDLVADGPGKIASWLTHRFGQCKSSEFEDAALIWLPQAMRPDQYPKTADDIYRHAQRVRATQLLCDIAGEKADRISLLLGAITANGPVLAGVTVRNPKQKDVLGRNTNLLTRGFRPGHVPQQLMASRFFQSGLPVAPFRAIRIDHDWIHGRGHDARQAALKQASVAILGCGSVGAPVAANLATAGVARILLVDPDNLDGPNTGRHPLGATNIGNNKAVGLAKKLQADYPHLQIDYRDVTLQKLLRTEPTLLDQCDLIISATGHWGAQTMVDQWFQGRKAKTKIIYGWTEAHACAGHATYPAPGCFKCGFDSTGVPRFAVTNWPEQALQEPACGAHFQPYGAVEIANTVTLVASLALDALLDDAAVGTHRFWAGPQDLLLQSGGQWSEAWRSHPQFRLEGNLIVQQVWPTDADPTTEGEQDATSD